MNVSRFSGPETISTTLRLRVTGKRAKMGANDLWSGQRSEVKHFLKFRTGYPLRTLPVRRCLLGAKRGFGWFLPLLREPANPDASRAKRICVPADTPLITQPMNPGRNISTLRDLQESKVQVGQKTLSSIGQSV